MTCRKLLVLLVFTFCIASCSRDPKVQARRYVENGNKFYEKSKFKEASIMYRRALQKDLRFGEAYYRLALADIKLAAFGDAVRALRRAVELEPDNADAAVKLCDILMIAVNQDRDHGDDLLKEAKQLADKVVQKNPNSYDGHRIEGQLALLRKDAPGAVKQFELATRAKPDQPDLSLAYFQALIANQQAPEAEKMGLAVIDKNKTFGPMYDALYIYYMQTKRVPEGERILQRKVDNNPQRGEYLVELGAHYLFTKQSDQVDGVIRRLADEKQFPEGHLLAGDFLYFRARDFDRAQAQYEAGEKAFPRDKVVYQKRLVELLTTTGRNQDANQLLATILKESPNDSDAVAMRAALMLVTGDLKQISQAVNDLQSLVAKTPDNHLLRFNLARAYVAKNDMEQARLQLEAAIKIRPDFILARDMLARIYLNKGDYAKALKEAEGAIALNQNDLPARLSRSSALMGIGDSQKARQELDSVLAIAPNNPDARYQAGYLAWSEKDYKRARQVFDDLYKSNPKDSRGLIGLIETMASENRMADAIKLLQDSVARDPERRDYRMALANLYVRDQRYDDAVKLLQELLKTEPKSADLLLRLAETQRRKGDVNAAIETFRLASQAAPADARPLLQLGLLMDGTGRRDQAKPIYEQILKIQPDHPIALNNLAFIKAEEGQDLDEALTMAQRARQGLPNSPDVMDTLGWIYLKKNLSDDAVRTFKELLATDPNRAAYHYHYGMALLQKGDKPSAKRELETAIRFNPSKDDDAKIRQLLASL
ncbi:MAG TPA: tetratricopeptide repeat protein [Bryobacteraceae bacterium]|jgi:tetratricopeptide (TPR) repeat protein|nr:tetratricopeptide repeat protein [Bryobacteraceae bacterium]